MARMLSDEKFDVDRVEVKGRDGQSVQRHVIVHPGAAVILPLLGDHIVMIENRRFAIGRTLLELPAGTIDPPETPEQCARRELEEETGYRAGSMKRLLSFYSAPGFCTEVLHAFVASELAPTERRPEPTEEITVLPLPVDEVEARLDAGTIVDAKTLTTLMFWLRSVRDS